MTRSSAGVNDKQACLSLSTPILLRVKGFVSYDRPAISTKFWKFVAQQMSQTRVNRREFARCATARTLSAAPVA